MQKLPYHVFDGDGMVHMVQFESNGSASYSNAWVRTRRLNKDAERGFTYGDTLCWATLMPHSSLTCSLAHSLTHSLLIVRIDARANRR